MDSTEHQDLVNTITGVHDKLRKSLFLSGDLNKVWQDHVAEEDLRKSYSLAMLKLATKFWGRKECRIDWTYNTCINFFYNGGLERSLEREKRLSEVAMSRKCGNSISGPANQIENNYKNLNRKLRLLDVGSCYNPFSKFSEFSCVAIDLTPATEDVLQCDFLKVDILDKNEINSNTEFKLQQETFDIIVLSLVLEYLPASEQRLTVCTKAWELLQPNGLCIIITPDSKCLNRNAPMIKSWKLVLEKIGFLRIKYEKLTHLHCMAFRKTSKSSKIDISMHKSLSKLFYIPQDFKTFDQSFECNERTEEENDFVCKQFLELPNENMY